MKKLFKINGMDCMHCKSKLENALKQLKGVEVEVDLETQIATIKMPDNMKDEVVLKKITESGYDGIVI